MLLITERIKSLHDLELKTIEVVREFRGVIVLKVEAKGNLFALKFIEKKKIVNEIDYDPVYRIFSLIREAKILKDIKNDFQYYFLDGDDEDFTWMITHWIEGENSTNYLKQIKNDFQNTERAKKVIETYKKIIHRFSLLHDKQIIHGDVQPVHIIINKSNEIELLDFGLSQYLSDNKFVYKGGLVHFNAPEIAKEMIKKADNIKVDILSEIYSLGSVLFFLYTGKTSTYYGTDDYKSVPFESKLKFIIDGQRSSFTSTSAEPISDLEDILNWMMTPDRSKRCSDLKEVITKLTVIEKIFS